jgi:hypothetical protein
VHGPDAYIYLGRQVTPCHVCLNTTSQVGGFFFIHRDDLKRMSKLWLKYTEDVRADKEVGAGALTIKAP